MKTDKIRKCLYIFIIVVSICGLAGCAKSNSSESPQSKESGADAALVPEEKQEVSFSDKPVNWNDMQWISMKEKMSEDDYEVLTEYLPAITQGIKIKWQEDENENEDLPGSLTLKEFWQTAVGTYGENEKIGWLGGPEIVCIQVGDLVSGNTGKEIVIETMSECYDKVLLCKIGNQYYGKVYGKRALCGMTNTGISWEGKEIGSYNQEVWNGREISTRICAQVKGKNNRIESYRIGNKEVSEKKFKDWEKKNVREAGSVESYSELPERKYNDLVVEEKTYTKSYKEGMNVTYTYPVVRGNSKAAKTINKFYKKKKKEWISQNEKYLEPASVEETTYYDTVDFVILYQDDTYIDVMQYGYHYLGGGHGNPYRINYIFSVKTGERLTATNILGKTKKEINQHIRERYLEYYNKVKDTDENPFMELNLIKDDLDSDWVGENFYYLSTEGQLIFFAPPYRLGSFAAGFIEVEY